MRHRKNIMFAVIDKPVNECRKSELQNFVLQLYQLDFLKLPRHYSTLFDFKKPVKKIFAEKNIFAGFVLSKIGAGKIFLPARIQNTGANLFDISIPDFYNFR